MNTEMLPALRSGIIAVPGLPVLLSEWKGEPAVFTRRPVPAEAEPIYIMVGSDVIGDNADGLNSDRPIVTHDIGVYGRKGAAGDSSDQTRLVDQIAGMLRVNFHRQRFSVQPAGFHVIGIVARGPFPAPVDDDSTVGRILSLTVSLRRQGA